MSEDKKDGITPPVATETPKLADGLFKPYTLGSILTPGAVGNVMSNVKPNMMDYEKQYQGSTKNQEISAEELSRIDQEEVKKAAESAFDKLKNKLAHKKNPPRDPAAVAAKIGREKLGQKEMTRRAVEGRKEHAKKSMEEIISEVPSEQREAVLAEFDRKIEEARKSSNAAEVDRIEKAKQKAKKAFMPNQEYGKY